MPIPDPLADNPTRALNLAKAWRRMLDARQKEQEMGYYRAGQFELPDWSSIGSQAASDPMGLYQSVTQPAATGGGDLSGPDTTVVTPALAAWRARHPGQAYPRRHRRMHVTNVKALRRAARRVTGFVHLAKKLITFTHHHKIKKARRSRGGKFR